MYMAEIGHCKEARASLPNYALYGQGTCSKRCPRAPVVSLHGPATLQGDATLCATRLYYRLCCNLLTVP
ncbi:hypothetical protein PC116_g2955 [Phytophthora cactorum]|nr:hypothetical protein Pcac1_g13381 [Phytophthora cactorum]KAG2906675.1 hypothetical protein PC114_g11075 [Phytophthora cactorum]KAG3014905.1 hypothetical protein PC119_g11970 [Phytophthora cactorum]KAG3017708.1 hypothetical protein PC120_g10874 [Phytophthora cactorum]KAG3163749.1 hypothetical protein C6341_g12871 [Phytophthora cactorum]